MISDVNISWGNWPFQSFRFSIPSEMKEFLKQNGINGGLVRSSEAAFSPDLGECNRKIFREFDGKDGFIPIATVNPFYSEWKKLIASAKRPLFAIFPAFHDYSILSEEFAELAEALAARNGTLLVVVREEDERGHHKLCKIPPVPMAEINSLAKKFPSLKIIALNCYFGEIKPLLDGVTNISADIAFAEKQDTVKSLLKDVSAKQLVFGSHTPFLYTDSSLRKLKDAEILPEEHDNIASGNLDRILNQG